MAAERGVAVAQFNLGHMYSLGRGVVVWKLDRLARSLKQLIETVEELGAGGSVCGPSPSQSTPAPRAAGWSSISSPPWRSSNAA